MRAKKCNYLKSLFFFLIIALSGTPSKAQEITRNNVYLEIGGASFFYSINYERLLLKNVEKNLAVRLGFMYINTFNDQGREMQALPVSVSYLKKLKKNYFELGLSTSVIHDTYKESGFSEDLVFIPSIRAGIRHQPNEMGFFWNTLFQYSLVAVSELGGDFFPADYSTPFISIGLGHSF